MTLPNTYIYGLAAGGKGGNRGDAQARNHSDSPWTSPIVPVKKKDGGLCLCVDYRKLNSVTMDDTYQMPQVDELIDTLGGARYITTLDLSKGYYQVPVATEDQPKTAFVSPSGKFYFTRMPFGLKGAPTTFQRLMDQLLKGMGIMQLLT